MDRDGLVTGALRRLVDALGDRPARGCTALIATGELGEAAADRAEIFRGGDRKPAQHDPAMALDQPVERGAVPGNPRNRILNAGKRARARLDEQGRLARGQHPAIHRVVQFVIGLSLQRCHR